MAGGPVVTGSGVGANAPQNKIAGILMVCTLLSSTSDAMQNMFADSSFVVVCLLKCIQIQTSTHLHSLLVPSLPSVVSFTGESHCNTAYTHSWFELLTCSMSQL